MARLTATERQLLASHSAIGKEVRFKERNGTRREVQGRVEEEVSIMVGQHKHVLQRIRFCDGVSWDGSAYAYRSGYYTLSDKARRLTWGQYAQLLTETEYRRLLRKAHRMGWPI